ncbi:MAG: choline ABC transporter permease subunit, partial [Pseudomonadota bacterium]
MEWLEDHKIPIGKWAKAAVDWLTQNAAWFFDGLAFGLDGVISALLFILLSPHRFMIIAAATVLAYVTRRSIAFAAFTALGLLLVINQGYWEETTETLALVLAATLVCMGLGVPI